MIYFKLFLATTVILSLCLFHVSSLVIYTPNQHYNFSAKYTTLGHKPQQQMHNFALLGKANFTNDCRFQNNTNITALQDALLVISSLLILYSCGSFVSSYICSPIPYFFSFILSILSSQSYYVILFSYPPFPPSLSVAASSVSFYFYFILSLFALFPLYSSSSLISLPLPLFSLILPFF